MNHLDLTSLPWTLSRADALADSIPAVVPGCVHTALLRAGRIEDPFAVGAEERLNWIGLAEWTYETEFVADASLLAQEHIELFADNLDTLVTLTLNGQEIGRADNQFREWCWDVRAFLQPGVNRLALRFESADRYLEQRSAEPVLRDGIDVRPLLQKRAWIRKMQCAWGWDWGVSLPSCGPLGELRLEGWSQNRLRSVQVRQRHRPGAVELSLDPELANPDGTGELRATLGFAGETVAVFEAHEGIVPTPRLWWPNGLGEQPLYDLRVELLGTDGSVLDVWTRRIGLRTVRLLTEPDAVGRSFEFEVNGHRFYAKGTNWIPLAPFVTSRDDRRPTLVAAREANMNMVRVWGGGLYEATSFYDSCDELGLLVWQDFMFACSNYPTFDQTLLASIRAEAEDQVRRLRHHASLAVWCGNNENDARQADTWGRTEHAVFGSRKLKMSWRDYDALYNRLLPEAVRRFAPEQAYIASSPHDPDHRRRAGTERAGDWHYWEAWFFGIPLAAQRTSLHRFVSEFGFQSAPTLATLSAVGLAPDAPLDSSALGHHQRCFGGNDLLEKAVIREFGGAGESLGEFAWRSQIVQGLALKYAIEHWRSLGGRNRGALVWQLNDYWPAFSWSTLDHSGAWKPAHHFLKRCFAPMLIAGREDHAARTIHCVAVNDLRHPVEAVFRWTAWHVDGRMLQACEAEEAVIPPGGGTHDFGVIEVIQQPLLRDYPAGEVLFHLDLRVAGKTVSEDVIFLCPPPAMALRDPGLQFDEVSRQGHTRYLRVSAERPALWVTFADVAVTHSVDDAFFLLPGRPREIALALTSAATVAGVLKCRSWVPQTVSDKPLLPGGGHSDAIFG